MTNKELIEDERRRYELSNRENIDFLMNRNNRINRLVIADGWYGSIPGFRQELARSGIDKILKRQLRAPLWERGDRRVS